MKRQAVLRGVYGFPLGVFIGYAITIAASLINRDGKYFPCSPELTAEFGSEIGAVCFQAAMSGVLGASYAVAPMIWRNEKWGIAKQTGISFAILSVVMFPIAFFTHWMERSITGFLWYFGFFVIIFVIIWGIQYRLWKNRIKNINKRLKSDG